MLGIYQLGFPAQLDTFLTKKRRKTGVFNPGIIIKNLNLILLKLEQPQQLVDNDFILPKLINDKVLEIYQTWYEENRSVQLKNLHANLNMIL